MPFVHDPYLAKIKAARHERQKEKHRARKLADRLIDDKAEQLKIRRQEYARQAKLNKRKPLPPVLWRPKVEPIPAEERDYYGPQAGVSTFGDFVNFNQATITAVFTIEGHPDIVLCVGGVLVTGSFVAMRRKKLRKICKGWRITGRFGFDENKTIPPWPVGGAQFRKFGNNVLDYIPLFAYQMPELRKQCMPAVGFYRWLEFLEMEEAKDRDAKRR